MKYDKLEAFLREASHRGIDEVPLTFDEIDSILSPEHLPKSAFGFRQWWENQRDISNRPQARAWMNAGYLVKKVFPNNVVFQKGELI